LASTLRCPVYSCELHRIPHLIAKMRLGAIENVTLILSDSRKFLRDLAELLPSGRKCFFYLDAHWHADLPPMSCASSRNVVRLRHHDR
jgi:hypothetical protein